MNIKAQTYAQCFALNYVQDRFANQTPEDHAEVVRLCCIIKPLVTWHGENVASICRERCGGQGMNILLLIKYSILILTVFFFFFSNKASWQPTDSVRKILITNKYV